MVDNSDSGLVNTDLGSNLAELLLEDDAPTTASPDVAMGYHVAPVTTWVFTAVTAGVLIGILTISFLRFRRRRLRKRQREEEYVNRFKMILPGFNPRDVKKTLARKIMTNTHSMDIAAFVDTLSQASSRDTHHLFASPRDMQHQFASSRDMHHQFAPIATQEDDDFDTRTASALVHHRPTSRPRSHVDDGIGGGGFGAVHQRDGVGIGAAHQRDSALVHRPDANSTSPVDNGRRSIPSQNSFDTTTDEEKPLVESATRDKKYRLRGYSPSLEKTVEHVLNGKRKQKNRPESGKDRERSNDKDAVSFKRNFKPTSLEYGDENRQNFIVYTPNEKGKRLPTEPVVYTFPPHADMDAYSNKSSMAVNNYYIEAGVTPHKHKSKHHKGGHKTDHYGKKKHRKLEESRARSLPQLEDVYHGNSYTPEGTTTRRSDAMLDETDYPSQARPTDKGRIFIKRRPLTSQTAHAQADNPIPLVKMRSLPAVSQSQDSGEAGLGDATFISEYM